MKKIKYLIFTIVALLLKYELALAQNTQSGTSVGGNRTVDNPLSGGVSTIPELLQLIINRFVLPIGGVIVVFMIIYTGFKFVIARGNESKLSDAKKTLVHTIIGAAIILGAAAISVIIETTLGEIVDTIR